MSQNRRFIKPANLSTNLQVEKRKEEKFISTMKRKSVQIDSNLFFLNIRAMFPKV